jgi:hypothetical protein
VDLVDRRDLRHDHNALFGKVPLAHLKQDIPRSRSGIALLLVVTEGSGSALGVLEESLGFPT